MGDIEPPILRTVSKVSEIPAEQWNACANPDPAHYNPFTDHAFLLALEESGSAIPETGWAAQHLILESSDAGQIAGIVPLYLKSHSQGEYIFDHGWAEAWHRAGGQYYPKLLSAIPFTPAGGSRLLIRSGPGEQMARAALTEGLIALTAQYNASSLHINFLPEEDWRDLGTQGFLQRTDQQFHWLNRDFKDFDGFLASLTSRKRKNLKKERQRALENGIEIEWLTGDDLTEAHWDTFYDFYLDTSNRKWGQAYLTRSFFSHINATMPDKTLLVMARRDGKYIAGALNFIGGEVLFGRNWGCIEDHPFLHFELCYYQAIDFAITRGLKRVEAGAQGTHKLARGYEPCRTFSAHYIPHEGFREAIENFLEHERRHVEQDIETLKNYTPFKQAENQTNNKANKESDDE